jgi:hypothetical protein
MLPMEKSVPFTSACANEIIPSINRSFVYKAKEHVKYIYSLIILNTCTRGYVICIMRPKLDIIHLVHAGEGNMKIYSPKSIIFPEGNARGEYDTRG